MSGLPLPSNLIVYKTVQGANPAANGEIGDTIPAGKWWWLLSISVLLVQGATQTPQPVLQIKDGSGNVLYDGIGSTAAQAAGTTCRYSWAGDEQITGQIGSGAGVHSNAPLPQNLLLPGGYQITTSTIGIGANSDYGAPTYYVIEIG